MNYYAGVPVGLTLQTIAAGGGAVLSARIEQTMLLTRLRWSVPLAGLVLVGVRVHKDHLLCAGGPVLPLEGDGVWRFPAALAQVSVQLSIEVSNTWGGPITPRAIAFWGLRWDELTPDQRWRARQLWAAGEL
jgi:hypothetical protein